MPTIRRREFIKKTTGAALGLAGLSLFGRATEAALQQNAAHEKGSNLLFVLGDQWRRHALGFMNEDPVQTPCIDRFARESLVFDNAITCCPVCGPYRGTLMTGRYPLSNGVIHNGLRLPTEHISIADVLKEAGYNTGYVGKWHLDGGPGDHFIPPGPRRQGFDFWYANECFHQHFVRKYYADDSEPIQGLGWQPDHETDVAIDYIKTHGKDKPFALFLAWHPPHTNHGGPHYIPKGDPGWHFYQYQAPERFEALYRGKDLTRRPNVPYSKEEKGPLGTYALPGYFGAVTSLDENFGRLLECLDEQGLAENTIVVLTADHGEMMGSQGGFTKCVPYEESIGIPFIIRWPGHTKPGRDDLLFNSVDVMPSLLGLMGLAVPSSVEGTDYSAAMRGRPVRKPHSALIEYFRDTPESGWRGLRTRRYTYVERYVEGQRIRVLFDNANDPYQMNPRELKGDARDPLMDELWEDLRGRLEKTDDPWLKNAELA